MRSLLEFLIESQINERNSFFYINKRHKTKKRDWKKIEE